jgi:hypothetical protein
MRPFGDKIQQAFQIIQQPRIPSRAFAGIAAVYEGHQTVQGGKPPPARRQNRQGNPGLRREVHAGNRAYAFPAAGIGEADKPVKIKPVEDNRRPETPGRRHGGGIFGTETSPQETEIRPNHE